MRGKREDAETLGDHDLAIALVLVGIVLAGLLGFIFGTRAGMDLLSVMAIVVVPVAVIMT